MTKKTIVFYALLLFIVQHSFAQITIGSDKKPETFSALEIVSTSGGLRHPQMTTVQRDKLLTGVTNKTEAYGLTIFNTTTMCIEFYKNEQEGWKNLCKAEDLEEIPLDDKGALIRPYVQADGAITEGKYGKLKYDIAKSNEGGSCGTLSEAGGRSGDFKTETLRKRNYVVVFPNITGVTDLVVGKDQDPYGIIKSVSGDVAGPLLSKNNMVLVTFVDDIETKALGTREHNALKATIYGVFKRDGVHKRVECTITVMDCLGCGVRLYEGGTWVPVMCYNLGADETLSPFEYNSKIEGDSYQWGRVKDGHQKIDSKIFYPTVAIGELNFPTSPLDLLDAKGQVTTANPRYGKFIPVSTFSSTYFFGDWSVEHNTTLWGDGTQQLIARKSATDPCPTGFRLPTLLEMEEITYQGMTLNDAEKGLVAQYDGVLYLPYAAHRKTDGTLDTTSDAKYWTGTLDNSSTSKQAWVFNVDGTVSANTKFKETDRAYGASVRCIAEQLND